MKKYFSRTVFIRLVCVIGFSIQLYCLTGEFIQFKVRNNIAYEYPLKNELPDIDIVMPMASAINLTALYERHGEEMRFMCMGINGNLSISVNVKNFEEICGKKIKEIPIYSSYLLQNYVTLGDIKELVLDNPDDKISIWWSLTDSMILSVDKPTNLCSISRFITSYAVFIRISCRNQTEPFEVGINQVSAKESGAKTQAIIRYGFDSVFGIRFSSPDSPPEIEFSQYSLFDNTELEKISTVSIRYSKTISTSLQYPYETACSHLKKTEILKSCLLEHTLNEKVPYIYPNILLPWNHGLSDDIGFDVDKMYANEGYGPVRKRQEHAEQVCNKKLPAVECHRISYATRLDRHPGFNPIIKYIMYEPPIDPTMYYTTKPALPLTEYLIFAGSIAGVWFGFSIFQQLVTSFGYGKCLLTKDQYSLNQQKVLCPNQISTVHNNAQNRKASNEQRITNLCKKLNYF